MEFGKIQRQTGEIRLDEWAKVINSHPSLIQAPDRKGRNPVTHEEVFSSGVGVALYLEDGEAKGNIGLDAGLLLATGVPMQTCQEIALQLGAIVREDDRS